MKAVWLEDRLLTVRDHVADPLPKPGEALIRVGLAGVCGTDLQLLRGYYPFLGVPGHEFVGEVAASPGDASWEGVRVVGEINAVCGKCADCKAGRSKHCPKRSVLGIVNRQGCFAEYCTLPLENLHRVPDSVPDECAVFTEPLAAALQIEEQIEVGPNHQVLVLGAGRLGQLIARSLSLTGCRLSAAVRHDVQRERLEPLGVTVYSPGEIPPQQMDIVVEATGSPSGLEAALKAVRPAGTVVLKSTYAGTHSIDFSRLAVDEIRLVGSRCGPFPKALQLLETQRVDPRDLIEETLPLAQAPSAFEKSANPGAFKLLLKP
ncbi:MAG: alcohol dehydrogenase catalytic domain-containing protein [Acidobacteriota bacterium]